MGSRSSEEIIGVTGASGHLGRLVIDDLLRGGVAPGRLVALVRSPEKARDLAERGVQVRQADYTQPGTLAAALRGVDRLLLVSGSEAGQRVAQHRNVVDAAVGAGVRFLAYTSILKAETSRMLLAQEHKVTEDIIRASGIPFAFLRNSWYVENYTGQLKAVVEHGALLGSADEGRVSAATRSDYAAAAAAVLVGSGHERRTYELGGDEAFTLAELAATIADVSGRPVEYRNLPEEAYAGVLTSVGLPEGYARVLADADRGLARGELFTDSGDLRRLIGRPTTSPRDAVAAALGAPVAA